MLVTVLTNLGVVLFGTAFGLAVAVNVETALAKRDAAGVRPPRLLSWHVHAITLYALGFHGKATVNHLVALDAGAPTGLRVVVLVVLGLIGNVSLLLVLRVSLARRAMGRELAARIAATRAIVELDHPDVGDERGEDGSP